MLFEVMSHIRNYFPSGKYFRGEFKIENGEVVLPFLIDGQYFLIEGSVLNDGVYQYPCKDLIDETFVGVVSALKVPRDFVNLVEEIEEWQKANGTVGKYSSESFGGYSYSLATNADGNPITWENAFASRLNKWRKI